MITIDDTLFLERFEDFEATLLPNYNRRREEKGLPPLTNDQAINLFLELRKKHGITGDAPARKDS